MVKHDDNTEMHLQLSVCMESTLTIAKKSALQKKFLEGCCGQHYLASSLHGLRRELRC